MVENKIKSIKKKLIAFFKNPKEVIFFFLPILITICLIIPVPYYVKVGGGSIALDKKIEIEDSYKTKGSFEALYVREARGIVITYLLSYIIPSFDREKKEEVVVDNTDNYDYREKVYFTTSLDAATKVAFDKASKKVDIASSKLIVLYIDETARTTLEVGDQIIKVEGTEINNYDELFNKINSKKIGDRISVTVNRDNETIETNSTIINMNGKPKLGVVVSNLISYETDPKVDFSFGGNEAGPSGGMMIALSIYNKLVKEDITHGKKVMGTGTIDQEGNIGSIGGIKHKLMAANRKHADIVLVPSDNYKEAKKIKDEKEYKFKLVGVSTFDDALNALK